MPRIKDIASQIKKGGIAAMPADTIYGLFVSAFNQEAVKKIAQFKGRTEDKPFIILVASWPHLKRLGINLNKKEKDSFRRLWPGPISVILSCTGKHLDYLHHGQSLAIRWPKNKFLTTLIKKTGPLVSTSANKSGDPPAETATTAKKIFGDKIELYLPARRKRKKKPSTLIRLENDKIEVLRLGQTTIKKLKQKLNYDFI